VAVPPQKPAEACAPELDDELPLEDEALTELVNEPQ